ncbi:MAG: hypothetical protein KDD66_09610 [Bdellovibrionales bacterium]|nr:hypothetical protein [Bdellovibrionales bacterium]
MKEQQAPRLGNDLLWEAIPLYELLDEAAARSEECACGTEEEMRRCAEQVIMSRICTCCTSEKSVIDSIVDEFVRCLVKAHLP